MNPQITKEIRLLSVPLVLSSAAAILCALNIRSEAHRFTEREIRPILYFLLQSSPMILFFGFIIMAGLCFGAEFQQRTLPLLLTQPVSRARVWRTKTLALACATLLPACLFALMLQIARPFLPCPSLYLTPQDFQDAIEALLSISDFVLATVCSACFWSLVARSVIGGIVLNLGSQFLILLATALISDKLFPSDPKLGWKALLIMAPFYSILMLWLGRRRFLNFQITTPLGGESANRESLAGIKLDLRWLRCRPTGSFANLVRKELRLSKALFVIAGFLTLCWLAASVLLALLPRYKETFELALNIVSSLYLPLFIILAGCISIGEEKSLGLNAWQLTIPVSTRRLWLTKLSISLILGLALGVFLPWLLSWLTSATNAHAGLALILRKDTEAGWFLFALTAILLISFWSATLFHNTIAAAIATVIALPALGSIGLLAAWIMSGIDDPIQTPLSMAWLAGHHLPPDYFLGPNAVAFAFLSVILPLLFLMLGQSASQFRRAQVLRRTLFRCFLSLAFLCFVLSLWVSDFMKSIEQASRADRLQTDLTQAIMALPELRQIPYGETNSVLVDQLNQTGKMTSISTRWLQGSKIELSPTKSLTGRPTVHSPSPSVSWYQVRVEFPRNRQWSFPLPIPQSFLNQKTESTKPADP